MDEALVLLAIGHRVPCLSAMRIVSLVPHATELLFALGLGDDVVAVTHECDFPAAARALPQITRDVLPAGPERRRDRRRGARAHRARRGDLRARRGAPARARARPHRHPGAVPGVRRELRRRARRRRDDLQPPAGRRAGPAHARRVLRRRPHDRPAHRLAQGRPGPHRAPARAGRRRAPRGAQGRARADGRHRVVRPGLRRRPLDAADRRASPAASTCSASPASTPSRAPGRRSPPPRRAWSSPCRAATTPSARTPRPAPTPTRCAAVGAERVVAVDASAYFSRPGPRLVDGLELMAHILHPDLVPEPVGAVARGRGLNADAWSAGGGQRADHGDRPTSTAQAT